MRSCLSEARAQALVPQWVLRPFWAHDESSKPGARYATRCFSESCLSEASSGTTFIVCKLCKITYYRPRQQLLATHLWNLHLYCDNLEFAVYVWTLWLLFHTNDLIFFQRIFIKTQLWFYQANRPLIWKFRQSTLVLYTSMDIIKKKIDIRHTGLFFDNGFSSGPTKCGAVRICGADLKIVTKCGAGLNQRYWILQYYGKHCGSAADLLRARGFLRKPTVYRCFFADLLRIYCGRARGFLQAHCLYNVFADLLRRARSRSAVDPQRNTIWLYKQWARKNQRASSWSAKKHLPLNSGPARNMQRARMASPFSI